MTPETRAKIGAALRGRTMSPEHRTARTGWKHTPEARARISASQRGRELTPEHRAHLRENLILARAAWTHLPFSASQPEQIMAAVLEWAGVRFQGQVRFSPYTVDFYLPDSNSVLEVDGVYWHPRGPDLERDARLLAAGVKHVVHVTDEQLRRAGWLG